MILGKKWKLILLPATYLILSLIFLAEKDYYYTSNVDTTYPYLFNGINIACGHFRSGNIVHPGTPVEIFVGLIIFIKHLFSPHTILYQDVLSHPENYLFTCSIVLSILLSCVIYFSGTYVYRHSGSLLQGCLFQAAPLFYSEFIWRTVSPSAESALSICGIFFAAYLYVNVLIPQKETSTRSIILLGLFTAIWFTTKIYTLVIILLILFLLKANKQRWQYLSYSGVFSLLLLFPLYNQFRNWLGFIKSEVFHSGPYGQGSKGILNIEHYWDNINIIFRGHYILLVIFLAIDIAFLMNIFYNLNGRKKFIDYINPVTGVFIFFIFFIVVISKQYVVNCPNPLTNTVVTITKYYYFMPIISFFPLIVIILYKTNKIIVRHKPVINQYKLITGIAVIFFVTSIPYAVKASYEVTDKNIDLQKTNSFVESWKNTPVILISDGGDQIYPQPALFLGCCYAGQWDVLEYSQCLKKLYPSSYIYSIGWRDVITFWGDKVNMTDILRKEGRALIYISGADSLSEQITIKRTCRVNQDDRSVIYQKIYSSDNHYEDIYLVENTKYSYRD